MYAFSCRPPWCRPRCPGLQLEWVWDGCSEMLSSCEADAHCAGLQPSPVHATGPIHNAHSCNELPMQTFALYNATSFPDEALRLREAKNLPQPSAGIFSDAQAYTNWQPAPTCASACTSPYPLLPPQTTLTWLAYHMLSVTI